MKKRYCVVFIIISFTLSACLFYKHKLSWKGKTVPCLKKIVIVGFRPVIPEFRESEYVRCPLSWVTFRGTKISDNIVNYMTQLLTKRILEKKQFLVITPEKVKKEFLDLNESIDNAKGKLLSEYLKQIGMAFKADAVILGHIFRWEERQGTDFAASKPASVAFDLHLIGTENGKILWEADFDKTQRSLTENILDIKTFFKGKGKWMTANKLADIGLSNMINDIIKTQKGCQK